MQPDPQLATDRAIDASVAFLAWWTVCCNATVLTEGSGHQLLLTAGISGVALLGLQLRARLRRPPRSEASLAAAPPDTAAPGVAREPSAPPVSPRAFLQSALRRPQAWALLLTAGVVVAWPRPVPNWVLWGIPAALIALFAVLTLREPWSSAPASTLVDRRSRAAIWAMALASAAVTACLHLPNTDDVLYVNIAVALADNPARTLFSVDTLHGASVIPHAAYRLHSFELLAGALSLVTGIEPLAILHLGLSIVAAALTPLAWWRLFRLLDPARAVWMVAAVLLWFVLDGTTPFSIPMHAFARLFQGKAVLLTLGVPALAAYGIELGLRPTLGRLIWLTAAQVAGLGLSATGVWLCPLVAVAGVIAAQPLRWSALKTVALACATSSYVLAMGVWAFLRVRGGLDAGGSDDQLSAGAGSDVVRAAASSMASAFDPENGFERIRKAFTLTFFTFERGMIYGALLLLAWPLARTALARRYIVTCLVVGWFALCSPWLARLVADRVTGFSTYPRVTWFLPFGAALAVCFTSLIAPAGPLRLRAASVALSAGALALFLGLAPRETVFEAANFRWLPRLKVERPAYDVALRLRRELPAGSPVLAPWTVALHLPMLLEAPLPIMTKVRFFTSADREQRDALRKRVERKGKKLNREGRAKLRERLNEYQLLGVVTAAEAEKTKGLVRTLKAAGFERVKRIGKYAIWTRDSAPPPKVPGGA